MKKFHILPLLAATILTISADAVVRIIRLMREAFKYVIIDTPPSFTDHVLAALERRARLASGGLPARELGADARAL